MHAQKPVAIEAAALFYGKHPETVSLFNPATSVRENLRQYVDKAYSLTLRSDVLRQISTTGPNLLRLQLPAPFNIDLDLYRVDIFSSTARIKTSDGLTMTPNPENVFYRGIISGNSNSLAIVSVFKDKIQVLFADENGNKRIQQTEDGSYIAFEDKDILIPSPMNCFVDDSAENSPIQNEDLSSSRNMTGNCVEVYVECDFKSYQDNGSNLATTEAWATALWHEVITLYGNESIPVIVSDIFVYTSTDPYASLATTSAILTAFTAHIDTLTYNGRLAHFLSTRALGGGIAWINVICSNSNQTAVSTSLSTTIVPVPTFSWNVECVTHEMGHNMGSPHTHACAWNGNNTAIDGCGPAAGYSEGACPTAPLPVSGTIMSYCHLVGGVGINFNNGFGTQPGNLIRSKYNNATCNTGTCSPPSCTALIDPVPNATNVDINNDLFWNNVQGANGFFLTIGTTPGGTNILNNANVGLVTTYNPGVLPFSTTIYVKIVPYNNLGSAIGCNEVSFVTEASGAPACTHLTSPLNGTTNVALTAVLKWAHSVGNQTGYKISIGTTPGGTQIANQVNVGNVNTYDPPGLLPPASTIYVKITPYWASGDINGCPSESFTTVTPINGDLCAMAINLPCGVSVSGTTTNALVDPEAFTCGTDIQAPGIWYTFVGNGQNTVISTCSQYSYDTQLNAYSGSCTSLACVTGIDDFCAQGSQITFLAGNGVTYFILVQGWGGETGTFTLTRTCYPGPLYCQSSGYYPTSEWIKTFSFAGYSKQSGISSYSDFTSETITVSRGGSYPVTITPQFLQGSRTEYYRVWIDLNKDGDFSDGGEQVFSGGPSSAAVSGTISVPVSAVTGTTRMRVSMDHAEPPPFCGTFLNGEVEDYTVNIKCNLVTSALDDGGNGTLRSVSVCADDNENILFASALNNQTISITTGPLIVDGIWKWMADPGANIVIKATQSVTRVLSIPVGKSAEIQYLTLIGGTSSPGSAIDNAGTLILRNSILRPATSSTTIPLRNAGLVTIFGPTSINN